MTPRDRIRYPDHDVQPRVIERWFPTAEVSEHSSTGWGSSNRETTLFNWFAKRPLAQARAAVLCSLLKWPEDETEQQRFQAIIRESLGACQDPNYVEGGEPHAFGIQDCVRYDARGYDQGYNAARSDILELICEQYPDGAELLDPFAGRGLLPLEGARYQVQTHAIDYSPVAALASRLLIEYPFRDWDEEPDLPFPGYDATPWRAQREPRLIYDVQFFHDEVQRRWTNKVEDYYPNNPEGEKPWGYLWAITIPCAECGRPFPLYGSNELRMPAGDDPGQSFELRVTGESWEIDVVSGMTTQSPTLHVKPGTKRNKFAWCPFYDCGHAHPLELHKRIASEHFGEDEMLAVADLRGRDKVFRAPTPHEREAAASASDDLESVRLSSGLEPKPWERIAKGNAHTVRAILYGAETYGDLSNDRQTLAHARLAETIDELAQEMVHSGCSTDYAAALAGYAGATLVTKLKYATRGARLYAHPARHGNNTVQVDHIFINESSLSFNYDYFETGIGDGPGTWRSVQSTKPLENPCNTKGVPARVQRASALSLYLRDETVDAVVTDPPYGDMIEYSNATDLFYVWLKRALAETHEEFAVTANPDGTQEKDEEIIVLRMASGLEDHRTEDFYAEKIAESFAEARRVVDRHGVVTIVFGHNDPDVWKRLLAAIERAGLVLTGSWPANTEAGGSAGSANIVTTLTITCRPAPTNRVEGRVAEVDAEVRREITERIPIWDGAGLALQDQLMAAAGPAMEVVGRYSRILDKTGEPVDISRYLPLARKAVEDAADIRIDELPLGTFDVRTRFALFWVRLYGRGQAAASEARWQRLASDMSEDETVGLLASTRKGVKFTPSTKVSGEVSDEDSLIDVALAMARAWRKQGLSEAAQVMNDAGRAPEDPYLWACIRELSGQLPDADKDGEAWTAIVRNRRALVTATQDVESARRREAEKRKAEQEAAKQSPTMFDDEMFPPEGTLFNQGDEK